MQNNRARLMTVPSFLTRDTRLGAPVSLKQSAVAFGTTLSVMQRATKAKIYTESKSFAEGIVSVACDKQPTLALMDALAALFMVCWKRDDIGGYQLAFGDAGSDFIYLPKTAADEERHRGEMQFLQAFANLPSTLREDLTREKL